jgi:hypothetical protein
MIRAFDIGGDVQGDSLPWVSASLAAASGRRHENAC